MTKLCTDAALFFSDVPASSAPNAIAIVVGDCDRLRPLVARLHARHRRVIVVYAPTESTTPDARHLIEDQGSDAIPWKDLLPSEPLRPSDSAQGIAAQPSWSGVGYDFDSEPPSKPPQASRGGPAVAPPARLDKKGWPVDQNNPQWTGAVGGGLGGPWVLGLPGSAVPATGPPAPAAENSSLYSRAPKGRPEARPVGIIQPAPRGGACGLPSSIGPDVSSGAGQFVLQGSAGSGGGVLHDAFALDVTRNSALFDSHDSGTSTSESLPSPAKTFVSGDADGTALINKTFSNAAWFVHHIFIEYTLWSQGGNLGTLAFQELHVAPSMRPPDGALLIGHVERYLQLVVPNVRINLKAAADAGFVELGGSDFQAQPTWVRIPKHHVPGNACRERLREMEMEQITGDPSQAAKLRACFGDLVGLVLHLHQRNRVKTMLTRPMPSEHTPPDASAKGGFLNAVKSIAPNVRIEFDPLVRVSVPSGARVEEGWRTLSHPEALPSPLPFLYSPSSASSRWEAHVPSSGSVSPRASWTTLTIGGGRPRMPRRRLPRSARAAGPRTRLWRAWRPPLSSLASTHPAVATRRQSWPPRTATPSPSSALAASTRSRSSATSSGTCMG